MSEDSDNYTLFGARYEEVKKLWFSYNEASYVLSCDIARL
jgi:hypothetical protein